MIIMTRALMLAKMTTLTLIIVVARANRTMMAILKTPVVAEFPTMGVGDHNDNSKGAGSCEGDVNNDDDGGGESDPR